LPPNGGSTPAGKAGQRTQQQTRRNPFENQIPLRFKAVSSHVVNEADQKVATGGNYDSPAISAALLIS
jgi:hypothetical protein